MKKYVILPALALVLISGTALAKSENDPFSQLWNALSEIQNQIESIQLIPGPQGPEGPTGPQGEQGPKGDTGVDGKDGAKLVLQDGNGQKLGYLLSVIGDDYRVFIPESAVVALFKSDITYQQLKLNRESGGGGIFFDDVNCTGTAFTQSPIHDPQTLFATGYNSGSGHYFKGTGDSSVMRTRKSYYNPASQVCENINEQTTNSYRVEEVQLPFSEPLYWPPRIIVQ